MTLSTSSSSVTVKWTVINTYAIKKCLEGKIDARAHVRLHRGYIA